MELQPRRGERTRATLHGEVGLTILDMEGEETQLLTEKLADALPRRAEEAWETLWRTEPERLTGIVRRHGIPAHLHDRAPPGITPRSCSLPAAADLRPDDAGVDREDRRAAVREGRKILADLVQESLRCLVDAEAEGASPDDLAALASLLPALTMLTLDDLRRHPALPATVGALLRPAGPLRGRPCCLVTSLEAAAIVAPLSPSPLMGGAADPCFPGPPAQPP